MGFGVWGLGFEELGFGVWGTGRRSAGVCPCLSLIVASVTFAGGSTFRKPLHLSPYACVESVGPIPAPTKGFWGAGVNPCLSLIATSVTFAGGVGGGVQGYLDRKKAHPPRILP